MISKPKITLAIPIHFSRLSRFWFITVSSSEERAVRWPLVGQYNSHLLVLRKRQIKVGVGLTPLVSCLQILKSNTPCSNQNWSGNSEFISSFFRSRMNGSPLQAYDRFKLKVVSLSSALRGGSQVTIQHMTLYFGTGRTKGYSKIEEHGRVTCALTWATPKVSIQSEPGITLQTWESA